MNAWTFLGFGILCEVVGTTCLKLSNGFSEWLPSLGCVLSFILAMVMIAQSVKTLDISLVYAIWSGVGVALITLIGALFFHEQLTLGRLFFIALIVIGVVGLQLTNQTLQQT